MSHEDRESMPLPMSRPGACLLLLLMSFSCLSSEYITTRQMLAHPPIEADHRISYGTDSLQFGDLRLPETKGPYPVVVLLHGGCWLSIANLNYLDQAAESLTALGFATWNMEFRPVDHFNGGWPNTFLDVEAGLDHLRELADPYDLDLNRVVIVGHSSGGHLGLWLAARKRIPESSVLYINDPLAVAGVVNIAGPADLEQARLNPYQACGSKVIDDLVGGVSKAAGSHYEVVSPAKMLPLGVRQILLAGMDDRIIPPELIGAYAVLAKKAGDDVHFKSVPNAAHFELVAPRSEAWSVTPAAIYSILKPSTERQSCDVEQSC